MIQGFLNSLGRHAAELRRLLRNHKWESTGDGLLIPDMGLLLHGRYAAWKTGETPEFYPNRVVTEGLTYTVAVAIANGTQIPSWFLAPFSGNITPAAGLTAATFTATATEYTNYDEATRQAFVPGAVSAAAVDNLASVATITNTGPGTATIYGAGLISVAAKGATTGKLFSAGRFATTKVLDATEQLNVSYGLTATSA